MPTIFLALGTNIGSLSDNLLAALGELSAQVSLTSISPVYEAEPMYMSDQPSFLNLTLQGETNLTPDHLLSFIKGLEIKLGRTPSPRYGPRLIDIDLLFYGSETRQSPKLVIPHPRLHERAFVLRPLADIRPDWVHPRNGHTVAEMLAALTDEQCKSVRVTSLKLLGQLRSMKDKSHANIDRNSSRNSLR